jgi:hypothetical protein
MRKVRLHARAESDLIEAGSASETIPYGRPKAVGAFGSTVVEVLARSGFIAAYGEF